MSSKKFEVTKSIITTKDWLLLLVATLGFAEFVAGVDEFGKQDSATYKIYALMASRNGSFSDIATVKNDGLLRL